MPENRQFTDLDLQAAARQTAEAMLSSLPSRQACCAHTFSETFLQKIDLLLRKYSRKATARRVWQRVAVVLLVMLLSATTWLTVDTHAREKLFQWTKEVVDNIIVHHLDGGDIDEVFSGYEPTWLPEGFVLVDSDHSDEFGFDYYYYENAETGQVFYINCNFMKDSAMTITQHGAEEPTIHDINGNQGKFYQPDEISGSSSLIWVDENSAVVFIIEGNISEQEMLHISRGIIPSN